MHGVHGSASPLVPPGTPTVGGEFSQAATQPAGSPSASSVLEPEQRVELQSATVANPTYRDMNPGRGRGGAEYVDQAYVDSEKQQLHDTYSQAPTAKSGRRTMPRFVPQAVNSVVDTGSGASVDLAAGTSVGGDAAAQRLVAQAGTPEQQASVLNQAQSGGYAVDPSLANTSSSNMAPDKKGQ